MSRRTVVAAVLLVALALVPAGAFSGVFASGTTGSGLAIEAANSPNGEYADFSSGRLALDFSAGGGLSDNAINRFDAVFTVTNDRSYEAPVWVNDSSGAITFYNTSSGASVEGEENGPSLAPGETLVVGVSVDTREASVGAVESTDNFSVETLVQEATPTATESGSSGTETTGTDSTSTTGSTATPTATATATSSSDGGGGGGSGSGGGTTESSYTVHDTSSGATVNVREGVAGDPIEADLGGSGSAYVSGAGTTVETVDMALTFDRTDWRVELTNPTDSPQDAPAVSSGEPVSYFQYDAYNVEASAFDSIAVNVTASDLPSGTDPSQVTVYRHTADGWQPIETTHLGGDQYRAQTDGFGEFAVVVEKSSGSTETSGGSDSSTGGTNDTPSGTEGSVDGTQTGGTETATDTAVADPGNTPTATAVDRLEDQLPVQSGMGPATVLVIGLFTAWLGVRGRVGGNGPGGL